MPHSTVMPLAVLALLTSSYGPSVANPASDSSTPAAWTHPGFWQFHIVDAERNWLGSLVLEFTATPVKTCTDGEWKVAKLVRSSTDFFKLHGPALELTEGQVVVAYLVDGITLGVDLNGNICDNNYFLIGELYDSGAAGQMGHTHMGPRNLKQLGWFTAAPVYTP